MAEQHKRRQIFITKNTYIETTKYLLNSYHRLIQKRIEYNKSINDLRRLNYFVAEEAYQLLSLH